MGPEAAQASSSARYGGASPLERPSPRRYILFALASALVWVFAAWFGSARHVDRQLQLALAHAEKDVASGIADIGIGLRRNLAVYHGIPAALGRDRAIREALAAFPADIGPSPKTREQNRAHWHADPVYARLNRNLAASAEDIPAFSVIWVMNAAGDTIAASNAETRSSFVGTNYADREYFKAARDGRQGNQFAVGRVTGIPGLFFSAPVIEGGRFLGAVAVKIDLPFLAFWVNQANAFVSDPYGVIIMAQESALEMHSLPGATVHQLSPAERAGRYRKEQIPELVIAPWNPGVNSSLKRLGNQRTPMLMASEAVPGEGLVITVMHPVPRAASRDKDRAGLFVSVAGLGVLAIGILATTLFFVGNWQRVRRYRAQQAQIEYLATHDTLTGLFSRGMLEQLIPQAIALSERTGRRLAVMFVDLDLFKNINDSMGHEVGDVVLHEVAQRLRGVVRAADPVVRQGGDEFIVILNDLGSVDDAAHVARKLIDVVSEPYVVNEVKLKLSASVGIAVYPEDGDTVSMLVRNADSALYHAKDSGRADFHFYHASMNADSMARLALENALREAIERREFVVYYQPQCSLGSQRITGCEALVRWRHPVNGLVPPGDFIPIAEKTGLIVALDEFVLFEACHQMEEWRQQLGFEIQVAVNISAVDFRKPGLVERVQRALAESGLPPGLLELELTESAIMENSERAVEILAELKGLGVRLAIDDFGTGYSSLAYLKAFDADMLKIDQTFVRDIEIDANDRAIVGAIIQLAKSIDCTVIAEGVETEAHAALLDQLGCILAQGYWLSKPLPGDQFVAFMATRTSAKRADA